MNTQRIILPNEILLGEVAAMLKEGHSVVLMTKGNSMLPFIVGGRDSVELVRRDAPAPGDIALAQITPGHYVLHRVISVEDGRVTLKGDGNLVGTEKCTTADICGIVTAIVRPGGRRTQCGTKAFARKSRTWASLPYIIRRYTLSIIRRII